MMNDDKDYAHVHDPQAQRSRFELWVIVAIAVVVIAGGLIWRAVKHEPASHQKGWGYVPPSGQSALAPSGPSTVPAAAAGVHPAPIATPRPAGP